VDPSAISVIALSASAKDMAENMYRALWSWLICVIVTFAVSMATVPKPVSELDGLVYGVTKMPFEGDLRLHEKPAFWAAVIGVVFIVLNIWFW
jgi:solute:Na+ symporter, SSS family